MGSSMPVGEKVLLVGVILLSVFFLVGSIDFIFINALFPRLFAVICIGLALLLLISPYLPEPIQQAITASGVEHSHMGMGDSNQSFVEDE